MNNWQKIELGELCDFIKGETGIAKALSGPYPLVTTGAERKTCATYQFDTKAVCLPTISSAGHGKRSLNYIHYQEGKFALGTILVALIPKDENQLNAKYLHEYLFHYKDLLIVPLQKGAANVSLPVKEVKKIKIPVPPISKQLKLTDLLQNIDSDYSNLFEENENQVTLINKLRQAILQEAVEGRLTASWRKQNPDLISGENHASRLLEKIKAEKERLVKEGKIKKQKSLPPISEKEKPFDLPEGWVWCRIGEIIQFTENFNIHSKLKPDQIIHYVDIDAIDNTLYKIREPKVLPVSKLSSRARRVLKSGFILFSLVRPYLNNIAIISDDHEFYIGSTGFAVFKGIKVYSRYLFYILLSTYIRNHYLELLSGFNSPSITHDQFINTKFSIPPLPEQQAIVEKVDRLMAKIDALEEQVKSRKDQAGQLMQAVLREAFNGG